MTDFNKVSVHGRIVRNAEFTTTDSGLYVARFAIAVNKSRRLPDGSFAPEDETSFFPLAVFGNYALKIGPYLLKGRGVLVDGHLKQQRWEKDGEKRCDTVIAVERIFFDPVLKKPEEEKHTVITQEVDYPEPMLPVTQEEERYAEQGFDFPPPEVTESFAIF